MRTADVIFSFGTCEVRIATREVLVDGRLQTAPPKVFDLLAYLLVARHRAVAKQELIDEVWRGAELSDSVLARTVMLARRVVGDSSEQPVWIQNVYGFGYRFVGPVQEIPQTLATAPAAPTIASDGVVPALRVGLFPVRNQTQDTTLAWTQVGLMALVGHALERDRRLAATAIGSDFFQQLPAGMTTGALARDACEFFGLDHVVHAVLRSQGGRQWLDYEVFSRRAGGAIGSLRDGDPIALCERLAKAIADSVLSGANSSGELPSRDAFVNQIFARAMECVSTHDWRTAGALVAAAGALEPDNLTFELERVRCMIWLKDPAGLDCARALLERVRVTPTVQLLSGCHDLIAQGLNLTGDPNLIPLCVEHREEALAWADKSGPTDLAISLRISAGNFFMEMGQYERSRVYLNRALADSRSTDNLVRVAACQQNLAIADRNEGDLIQAKQRLEHALQIWRRLTQRPMRGHALAQLALVNLHLGLFDEAAQQCDDALSCFNLDLLRTYDGATVAGVGLAYLHLGRTDAVDRLAEKFREAFADEPSKPVPFHVAAGCAAIGKGHSASAREHLVAAACHDGVWPGLSYRLRCLHALLHMEMAQGDGTQLENCIRAFESLKQGHEFPEWKAGVRYAQAAQFALSHERDKALSMLMSIVTDLPLSMSSQMARLDAAWLLLERGDTETASTVMNGAPTWRDAHPAGLALKARLKATEGLQEDAHRLQMQALARHRLPPHPGQLELSATYERAGKRLGTAAPAPIPCLPRLLCSTFVSGQRAVTSGAAPAT